MKPNEPKKIWTDTYRVHSYDMDMHGIANMPQLCKYMQESAWHHAENLGVGFSSLIKQNKAWVLSGLILRMEKTPNWGETVTVHTWPSNKKRLAFLRDFDIINQKKEVIGMAATKWFVIDLDRRRPCDLDRNFDFQPERHAEPLSQQFNKLASVEAALERLC